MKKIILTSILILLLSIEINAQITMCFKQNYNNLESIMDTRLDGGECKGLYSINEMKNNNWNVNDIKITPSKNNTFNFIYILKKDDNPSSINNYNSKFDQDVIEERIINKLDKKRKQEKEFNKKTIIKKSIASGKILYSSCSSCHGKKGEISIYNLTKPLKDLSIENMDMSITKYMNDESYGYGYQIIMRQYAYSLTEKKLTNIKNYLDSLDN